MNEKKIFSTLFSRRFRQRKKICENRQRFGPFISLWKSIGFVVELGIARSLNEKLREGVGVGLENVITSVGDQEVNLVIGIRVGNFFIGVLLIPIFLTIFFKRFSQFSRL